MSARSEEHDRHEDLDNFLDMLGGAGVSYVLDLTRAIPAVEVLTAPHVVFYFDGDRALQDVRVEELTAL